MKFWILMLAATSVLAAEPAPDWAKRDLRAGVIGTDTSHVPAFAGLFQSHPEWKIKVVAAFKGGSPDIPASADRLEKFAATLQEKYNVEIVPSIEELLKRVDVVLLQSVDGRPHLAQATPVLKAGKRLFIDKPVTASLEDARKIVQLSKETGTLFFSCSSSRFHPELPQLLTTPGLGKITKVQGSSPLNVLKDHPDLFFYGIHGVEVVYAVLGRGCVSVTRKMDGDADVTTGKWKDGRIGIYRSAVKGKSVPMISIWGEGGSAQTKGRSSYEGLVRVMAEFFHTGRVPVDPLETLEIVEFMTAAQLSKERGGAEVSLAELRTKKP